MTTETVVVITVQGTQVLGVLPPSTAASSVIAQLPLELSFADFGGQEKIARLPSPLSLEGMPSGSDASPGMIGYYAPEQAVVLYYETVGYYEGIIPIGTFDDVGLIRESGPFTATVSVSE